MTKEQLKNLYDITYYLDSNFNTFKVCLLEVMKELYTTLDEDELVISAYISDKMREHERNWDDGSLALFTNKGNVIIAKLARQAYEIRRKFNVYMILVLKKYYKIQLSRISKLEHTEQQVRELFQQDTKIQELIVFSLKDNNKSFDKTQFHFNSMEITEKFKAEISAKLGEFVPETPRNKKQKVVGEYEINNSEYELPVKAEKKSLFKRKKTTKEPSRFDVDKSQFEIDPDDYK